ncbi:bifunctional 2-C-methyl-D-erythritol 4-phosphate cytidylyltransferase/2-C-methyl-D-erythritol 2,4-cyclodiphosphate synthase [Aquabacter sp. L1I39]|uniref:bifunctional 2-C-methyl-D-erythritol 4-phosphate cytidylyltransferase/2-C-methyl-D-erythritol 2,4-cyclodiphosphate synthase n=1 Tax=Aquabacter sp. L1I39 TaxID=2820278 RepID=UPI001ADAA9C5|nr:bifunctional 2-C-methyl-D-erythritol 4-phosphate cytidylyltransferase/2-C-methyl-D-erythritol 2,4-cyclodiphosphate synthase [Aquabacter sp. L1I39]QTL01608.1 bifunctional 2-C-methyl-D-erythritol 4-phosphate cytidylyltransferase/2-C-methyl-D-erythritol 2,4-cyclodiphosphate synthase [Aquabacter sp. L1I39]
MECAVIIVAAGRGSRMGGDVPKQYRKLNGESVMRRVLRLFCDHPDIATVQVVIHPDDAALFAEAGAGLPKLLPPVPGGAERQDSVRAGLDALAPHNPDVVLVHDAARPFTSAALISRAVEAGATFGAAVPGAAVTDTIKMVDAREQVTATPARASLRAVQTPQAFHYESLRAAHLRAQAEKIAGLTDDAAVVEWAGHPVTVFEGETSNVKLTHPEDLAHAGGSRPLSDVRTGTGFDVHAFGPGDHVILGGIALPFDKGLDGHSDADVGLHALTDAVLGALCDGDIGAHFPPSDPQWKGATSDRFLAFAAEKVRARGGRIAHLDLTLICEAPKIGPHREPMRARIAEIAGVPVERVSVKATTTEKLGFAGRREGIAAMAAATIRLPEDEA